jgi:hypothetical protein
LGIGIKGTELGFSTRGTKLGFNIGGTKLVINTRRTKQEKSSLPLKLKFGIVTKEHQPIQVGIKNQQILTFWDLQMILTKWNPPLKITTKFVSWMKSPTFIQRVF